MSVILTGQGECNYCRVLQPEFLCLLTLCIKPETPTPRPITLNLPDILVEVEIPIIGPRNRISCGNTGPYPPIFYLNQSLLSTDLCNFGSKVTRSDRSRTSGEILSSPRSFSSPSFISQPLGSKKDRITLKEMIHKLYTLLSIISRLS